MRHATHIGGWIEVQTLSCDASMALPDQMTRTHSLITKALLLGCKSGCRITDDSCRLDFHWRFKQP